MRLSIVAVLLLLLGCSLTWAAPEPTYKGKPLPEWIKALASDDPAVRRDAAGALGQIGAGSSEAAPALVKALTDTDEQVRRLAIASLGELRPDAKVVIEPLAAVLLKDRVPGVRQQAAIVLGQYGKEAKPALPSLLGRLRNPGENQDVRQQAARAIGLIGPEAKEAIPALVALLDDRDGTLLWFYAGNALAGIGPDALPAVIAVFRKADGQVNSRAVDAASFFRRAGVPKLTAALKSPDATVRLAAAAALANASPEDAAPARPILDAAVRDPDSGRRATATRSLTLLNFMTTPAVDGLVEALRDKQPAVRRDAASALGDHGPRGRDALPALRVALKDSDSEVLLYAALAVAQIDPEARGAVVPLLAGTKGLHSYHVRQVLQRLTRRALPALEEAMKDDDAYVRGEAALAILSVDRRAWKTALPGLTEWITSEAREKDTEALGRVRELDPLLRTALTKALLSAFEDKDPRPKLDVTRTPFGPIFDGPELDALCLALVNACGKDEVQSARALEKIRTLGPRARAAVPGLLALWKKEQDAGRPHSLAMVQTLGAIGPEAREAVPLLLASLDAKGNTREEVVRSLGKIGSDAKAALPTLVKLLKDKPDARLQPVLAEALGQIGPAADEAAPLLVELLRQKDQAVHDRVLVALPLIGNRSEPVLAGLKEFLEAEKSRKSPRAGRAALTLLQLDPDSTLACRTLVEAVDQYGNPTTPWQEVTALLQKYGRTVTPNLAEALGDTRLNGRQRALAAMALREIGPDAKKAREALRLALADGDRAVRVSAALALAVIDPTVAEAVPPLVDALDRPGGFYENYNFEDRKKGISGTRPGVPALLPRFGKAAVPELIAALKSPRVEQRRGAATALGDIGPDAREAADELLRVLKQDPDLASRGKAGLALSQVAPSRTEAVAPLLVMLKDPDFSARFPACEALGRFGPAGREARETLVELATHDRYRVGLRSPALRALVSIGAEADAITALGQHLRNPSYFEHTYADDFELIEELGPRAKALAEPLRDIMGWRMPYVRIVAARALVRVDPGSVDEAVESLELDLQNPYSGLRRAAARGLEAVGPSAKAAVPLLTKLLKDDDPRAREAAGDALKAIDPAAAKAAGVP
jgi:HEAT repeat protein